MSISDVQTICVESCDIGAYGDGWTGQDHVFAAYKRRYTRSGANLWYPVGLMDDREHDTSTSKICIVGSRP